MSDNELTGLQKALIAAGGLSQLADAVNVTQKTIKVWLKHENVEVPTIVRVGDSGVRRAVEAAGSRSALARQLGVSLPAVTGWVRQGWVPMERAREIENTYGVPRIELVSAKVRNAMGAGGEL